MSTKKFLSLLLTLALLMAFVPETSVSTALAEPPAGNDVVGDVEEWHWQPSRNSQFRIQNRGDSNSVTVTVTATDKDTNEKVPVPGAIVTLYIGEVADRTGAKTDADGKTTISLEDLTEEELHKATISAYKVIDQTDAIDDVTRDPLFNHFPDDEEGENIRLEFQLHSEKIDEAGNWIGEPLPISYKATNKADIVFVIDATGSMYSAINNVKTNLAAFSEALIKQGLDIRFGIVEYRDISEGEDTKLHVVDGSGWYTELHDVTGILTDIRADGGGDTPESVMDALGLVAQDNVYWRSDARKYAFLLTDANYKTGNNYGYADMNQLINDLVKKEIVTSVITRNSEKSTYAQLYGKTGGIFADIFSSDFREEMLKLAQNIVDFTIADMSLHLSEPRFLYNLSVCYLADDKTSQSASYRQSIERMLSAYAQHMAQATDGHVLINKVLLMPTNSRMNFYAEATETAPGSGLYYYEADAAAMADIRIETREKDDGNLGFNVKIHSNAYVGGFNDSGLKWSDESVDQFSHLKDADSYRGRLTFARIQMSGIEGAGWNNSMIDDYSQYATTVAHESGHYIFGFYDEYLNRNGKEWNIFNRPYGNYGLMDGQHYDIELSKAGIDYSYFGGSFPASTNKKHTKHSSIYLESTEDTLADMLTTGISADGNTVLYSSPYKPSYTKAKKADRNASYSYAALTSRDFIVLPDSSSISSASRNASSKSGYVLSAVSDPVAALKETQNNIALATFDGDADSVVLSLSHAVMDECHVYARVLGEDTYYEYRLTADGGALKTVLPIKSGDMAEVFIANDTEYNRYYVDRFESTDIGALYTSMDSAVMAYTNSKGTNAFTFVADNTGYENGKYHSVNQATFISADGNAAFNGGEIYSVASHAGRIDYTSISWFWYADGVWTKLETDCSMDEALNIGARADLCEAGLYVLMAKDANTDAAKAVRNLDYARSKTKDGVITLSFKDPNANTSYYNVYYANEDFDSVEDRNLVKRTYTAESTSLTLDLLERERTVYLAVEAVLDDGSRSPLSSMLVITGTADSDGDGVPDWYCNKYLLWPEDGKEKDIANSDDDGDGLSNLEEYKRDSDPRNPNDPYYTSSIPVTSISIKYSELQLACGQTFELKAVITPETATNKAVIWTAETEGIVSLSGNSSVCQVTGLSVGTTTIYATTQDGGYAAKCVVTVLQEGSVVLPPTGDSFQPALLIVLLFASALCLTFISRNRRQQI